MGVKANDLITKLMRKGQGVTINATLDQTIAEGLALDYGLELHIKEEETQEEKLMAEFDERFAAGANMVRGRRW